MDLKGGIGSASRLVPMDGKEYTVGALVMSNFGMAGNLVIGGRHVGREIAEGLCARCGEKPEQGSIHIPMVIDASRLGGEAGGLRFGAGGAAGPDRDLFGLRRCSAQI